MEKTIKNLGTTVLIKSKSRMEEPELESEGELLDSEDEDEISDRESSDEDSATISINKIRRAHLAQALSRRQQINKAAKSRQVMSQRAIMNQKRKMEAVRSFHDFTKKLKQDTGITIRSLKGGGVMELDDILSCDSDDKSDTSDGLSEENFEVDPSAVAELDEADESYIDPETGDIVEPVKKSLSEKKANQEKSEIESTVPTPKTLTIGDIINDNDLDLTKNVEISDIIEGSELSLDKNGEDILDLKQDQTGDDGEFDITEKLKEMGEISVKPVKKDSAAENTGEAMKPGDTEEDKKNVSANALNVRRNIRDVMDEKQLDASTLAAQRQESERLARVQEQQRIIREVQRQIAINRQTKQQQARAMSILQSGGASLLKKNASGSGHKLNLPNTVLVKLPSGEVKKTSIKPSQLDVMRVSKSGVLPIGQKILQKPDVKQEKKEVVEIVDSSSSGEESSSTSSDSDDCIMLSDSEVAPSPEPPDEDPQNSGLHVNDSYNVPDEQGRVVINIGHPENEEDIFLAPQIARIIKPHQVGGVRFLFDNIIESVERFSTSTGFGCILAHSMGLGKTLQIVCFCDIFLRHTTSKTVLCIMPINTLQNWVAEFNMWLPLDGANSNLAAQGEVRSRNFPIYVLNDSHKTLQARAKVVQDWSSTGGVLMIGYELYRLLSMKKDKKPRRKKKEPPAAKNDKVKTEPGKDLNEDTQGSSDNVIQKAVDKDVKMEDVDIKVKTELDEADIKKEEKKEDEPSDEDKKLLDEMYEALVKPGPDLVICDEGHRIKNSHSNISYALKQMRTKRRIVLTGYPLQNNLLEYWCMVDFVRPNYLGTKTEFSNMFERPIQNGQCIDSTPEDIRLMRYRAHVLHSLLVGFVQRRSHAVLQSTLPQKEEYVLLVRMTPLQRQLYDTFMNEVVRSKAVPNPLKAFAICCKIWNHPDVLYFFLKKRSESNAAVDLDLDLEEPGLVNAAGRKNSRSKGGAKKSKQPAKGKDKKAATSKPAATIPPNTTSSNPHFPPGPGSYPSNQYPPYGPSGFPPYPQNHGPYQPPGYHQYPPQPHNTYYQGGDSYNQNYNAGYYQQPYGNNYNQYPPNHQQGAPNYQQDQYWGNGSGYYGNSGYYNNQSYPPPGNHAPDDYQRNQDYSNGQSRPPYTGGDSQSFASNQTGTSAYPLNPAIPAASYPTHPGTSSAYPPNSASPAQYPPNRANPPSASFGPNPTAPTSYPANQNAPSVYPENQTSQGPYPSNQNVQPYSSNSSTPQAYPGSGNPSYGNSYSSEQATAYQPTNTPQDAQASFSNNNYNPYGENNATPTYPAFDRPVYPDYNANRSESQAPSQLPVTPAVETPAVTESYNSQASQATTNTPYNFETPTTPATFSDVPQENRGQSAFNDQFPSFDQNNLETKPPLGSADDQLPTWPLAAAIKSTVEPPKTDEESKIEVKSESDDGEVKIEDLDTKKIIHNEIKTENKSECIKEETKPDAPQAVTEGSNDMASDNAKATTPLETKDAESKKAEDNESSSEAKKESNKKKEVKERKKFEPKSKSKQKSPKQRAGKNGKDRKSSKDKKDESDTDKESEKEEKRDKEEEAALAKKHEEMTYDWATELLKDYVPGIIENSAKMEILFCILNESIKMGDRLLLFSQSLFTLNLIEDFLQRNYVPGTEMLWGRNKNYFRLDGSTSALEREKLINEFNTNSNVFLFLVSTRAGSLGINLVGANRVIVFDASWNPCHDTQAVCRVYRYGQQKPCFVYRLVMDCCLEKKIYDRQINKQGMADRVVDECNPDAVLSMKEITNLCWDNDEKEQEQKDLSGFKDKYRDSLMQKIIMEHSTTLSKEPFQHESLLVDRKEKKLSSAEKRLAQRGYELEKKAAATPKPVAGYRGTRPVASVRPMQHGARWIPADVWRRQGMTAQEMTLPLDVVIPTNSAEKTNIVLKAGQRVMVLKSPKGIYMQLESGKIIAIKTSFKVGQKGNDGKDNSNAVGKKIMGPRPQVNLPGSLKNNSAITVIPKGGRPGMQKVIGRPGLISQNKNLSVRPIISGQKIQDFRGRTVPGQNRPLPIIRNKAGISQQIRTMRPINIQSKHMGIKIQSADKEPFKTEEADKDGDEDSDPEPASGTNSNQSSIAGTSKADADELESGHPELQDHVMYSGDESDADNTKRPVSSPEVAEEDSSQEKTYVNLSEKAGAKRLESKQPEPKQAELKQSEPKQALLRPGKKVINPLSILKNDSLKERSLKLNSDFTETEYKNITIRRTAVPPMREDSGPSQDGSGGSVNLRADEKFPSEAALDVKTPPSSGASDVSGPPLAADEAELDDDLNERKIQKANPAERPVKTSSLKNYRHQKMGPKGFGFRASPASTSSAPTSPPTAISSDSTPTFESSLSRLERTAISISRVPKPGMTDFRQSLNNITKSYSPGASDDGEDSASYKPGPKSRKKKPSKKGIENFSEDSSSQSSLVTPEQPDKPAEGMMPTAGYNQPSGMPVHPGPSNRPPYPTGNVDIQGSTQPLYNQHYPGYLGPGNSYASYNPATPFHPQQYPSGAPGYPAPYPGYTPAQPPYNNAYTQNAPFPPNQQW